MNKDLTKSMWAKTVATLNKVAGEGRALFSSIILVVLLAAIASGCQSSGPTGYQLLTQESGYYDYPTWSPDGTKIAYLNSLLGDLEILHIDDLKQDEKPIGQEGIRGRAVVQWLNNSTLLLAFPVAEESGRNESAIYKYDMEADTAQLLVVTDSILDGCWSIPTQTFIFTTHVSPDNDYSPLANALKQFDPANNSFSTIHRTWDISYITGISCDNQHGWLVFSEDTGVGGDNVERLVVLDLNTLTSHIIQEVSDFSFDSPTWSPDSEWIAIRRITGKTSAPRSGIMLVSVEGAESIIILEPTPFFHPVSIEWSPVANELMIREQDYKDYLLYNMNLDQWIR